MRKRTLAALAVVVITVGAAVVAKRASPYAQIDECLEQKKMWAYSSGRCEPLPAATVDRILIDKSDHRMWTLSKGRMIREFRVALGRGGLAPKAIQGDGLVPEGDYPITFHNAASAYHLSLRIGYPNAAQRVRAQRSGIDPGGDIMIHGLPKSFIGVGSRHVLADWTAGCIAVTNREMDWLFSAVPDGTMVTIRA